jgi:hypothetical protein
LFGSACAANTCGGSRIELRADVVPRERVVQPFGGEAHRHPRQVSEIELLRIGKERFERGDVGFRGAFVFVARSRARDE